MEIELDGIGQRIFAVPVPAGNHEDLTVSPKRLFWVDANAGDPEKTALVYLDIANKGDKPETLLDGVRSYELSGDGKKLLIRKG